VIRALLRAILERLLILVALVIVSFTLPVATIWLVRDPVGAQVVFWVSPWVVAFWSVILYVLVGSRFWRGRAAVEEWKTRHGSYLWRAAKSTVWMFAALFLSYAAEFAVILFVPRSATAMHFFPIATYSPLAFTIAWSAARG
jgi:hypothetical protein